jgi:hypothetical protein
MLQWIAAFEKIAATSHYVGSNRFESFAPIRLNVAAQWLVDGVGVQLQPEIHPLMRARQRDYFWNMSRAILLAKESIYIHDWWLSPGAAYGAFVFLYLTLSQSSSCAGRERRSTVWISFLSERQKRV